MATVEDWVVMCATTPEFVQQYNRLYGSSLSFTPKQRTPIEAMVDQACGHVPMPSNDPGELSDFFAHCIDLIDRIAWHHCGEGRA